MKLSIFNDNLIRLYPNQIIAENNFLKAHIVSTDTVGIISGDKIEVDLTWIGHMKLSIFSDRPIGLYHNKSIMKMCFLSITSGDNFDLTLILSPDDTLRKLISA